MTRFENAWNGYRRRRLTAEEAGTLLGLSERHFRRLGERYEEDGADGLKDRRLGKRSPRQVPAGEVQHMLDHYRARHRGWNALHFHEFMVREHAWRLSYSFTRGWLQRAGLVAKRRARGGHRTKRPRRPLPGMMLFQDGSTHAWIPALGRSVDLVVTMDDATSEIYSAFFVEQEGTASSFIGLRETIGKKGLFSEFYTDRGSHYFVTPKAGHKVDKAKLTQVGRALLQLGIRHTPSYSPEARGRMERTFETLQGRLPHEIDLAGVTTIADANRFLDAVYLPRHNRRFSIPADQPGTAFVPYVGRPLDDILCVQEPRQVGNDNTVRWNGRALQIPPQAHRRHYVRATLAVHEYPDGALALFDGVRCLARYDRDGNLSQGPQSAAPGAPADSSRAA